MHLDEKERQDYHEEPTSFADRGTSWIVIGFLLWISDLFAVFAAGFYDIRVGHSLVLGWMIFAALAGFAFILTGWMIKRKVRARHGHLK
jgi:hypothetical protein